MSFTRITVSPDQMGGVPCIRGLRIPVATVVGMVADGMTALLKGSHGPGTTRSMFAITPCKPPATR